MRGQLRVIWLVLLLAAARTGCAPVPGGVLDAPSGTAGSDAWGETGSSLQVKVTWARSFGQEGEVPVHLIEAGHDRLLALTDQAAYLLDDQARVVSRTALPAASFGAMPTVSTALWDGTGAGLALVWGKDAQTAAGTYLALADSKGAFTPASMTALGPAGGRVLGDFDGTYHQVLWTYPRPGIGLDLHLTRVARAAGSSGQLLASGLAAGTSVGAWLAPAAGPHALCTVDPGGSTTLWRFTGGAAKVAKVKLADPGRTAIGPCHLATSGQAHLVTYVHRALPPSLQDMGPPPHPDRGLLAVTFNVPVAQVVDPSGNALAQPVRLSLYEGTVQVQGALWDGARFLVLLNAAGYRGGRLVLAAFGQTGSVITRDLLIPLQYEPGTLLGGRLIVTGTDHALLLAWRRPWDKGILYLARFTISGWP